MMLLTATLICLRRFVMPCFSCVCQVCSYGSTSTALKGKKVTARTVWGYLAPIVASIVTIPCLRISAQVGEISLAYFVSRTATR